MKFMQSIHAYDVDLFFWVMRRKSQKLLVKCARYISKTGDGYWYLLLALILAFSHTPTDRLLLGAMAVAFAFERPAYFIIKNTCRRHRPQAALNIQGFVVPSDQFSFPSGHTSAAFLMAMLLSYFHPVLVPLVFPWAVTVGMARVILGVHFPTDTLMGALMGLAMAAISLQIVLA
jgi:undecaprenyl-diphosphatase